jgi:hypothetical protein
MNEFWSQFNSNNKSFATERSHRRWTVELIVLWDRYTYTPSACVTPIGGVRFLDGGCGRAHAGSPLVLLASRSLAAACVQENCRNNVCMTKKKLLAYFQITMYICIRTCWFSTHLPLQIKSCQTGRNSFFVRSQKLVLHPLACMRFCWEGFRFISLPVKHSIETPHIVLIHLR